MVGGGSKLLVGFTFMHVTEFLSQNKWFLMTFGSQLLLVTLKLVWLTFMHVPEF